MKSAPLFRLLTMAALLPAFAGVLAQERGPLVGRDRSLGTRKLGLSVEVVDRDGRPILLYGSSHALVVGVSDYGDGWVDLPGVLEDVDAVARALRAHHFDVETLLNPTRVQLDEAINQFITKYGLARESRLLVYFAGHGYTLENAYGGEPMGFIVAADAPNPSVDPAGFRSKAVDMPMMEVYARRIQSRHALFVFDSCFSGSVFSLSRDQPPTYVSDRAAAPVRYFITAGSAHETVPDLSNFRRQFVFALGGDADRNDDGYVSGLELGEFLYETVVDLSQGSQHPQHGKIRDPNLARGDFFFRLRPKPAADSTTTGKSADPTLDADALFDLAWNAEGEKDYQRALAYFMVAAELGHAGAAHNVGWMYRGGGGKGRERIRKNPEKARRWYRRAAEMGAPPSMAVVGRAYSMGKGVDKDPIEAARWFRMAAEAGDDVGMILLGRSYLRGRGVAKDRVEAMRWFEKAADLGNTGAMIMIGWVHVRGEEPEGIAWFQRAAEAGDAGAMFLLGQYYEHEADETDFEEAMRWYRAAADAGDRDARAALKELEQEQQQ